MEPKEISFIGFKVPRDHIEEKEKYKMATPQSRGCSESLCNNTMKFTVSVVSQNA